MKKTILVILLFIAGLCVLLVVKTVTHPFAKLSAHQLDPIKLPVTEKSIKRFSGGLQFATVSYIDSAANNFAAYDSFRLYVRNSYPHVFQTLTDTLINGHQWLLRWKGKNSALKPLLFMSHYDVVAPGDYSHEESSIGQNMFDLSDSIGSLPQEEFNAWKYAPFSGAVKEGRIYGRGAIDMKGVVFALLEAADTLLAAGFVPARDIYLAFDPDEEVGGLRGAAHLATYLKAKGLQFETIYDEGGIVATPGTAEGINQNIAFVGMGEKGVVGFRIKVKGTGGHSSMPPLQSAAGKAAVIMQRLEQNQFRQRLIEPTENFLNVAGAGMSFMGRMAIANQWLLSSVLLKQMEKNPQANALTRTTTAITMLKGSDGNNVLAPVVEVIVNFRILPGETSSDVHAHILKACEGFEVEIDAPRVPVEPSKLSPPDGRGYDVLKEAVERLYPGTLVTPYLTIGATDCKHMGELSDRIYRFMPVLLNPFEQRSIHNFNEYLSIDNYGRMIAYYSYLMGEFDKGL
ncbi:MAG: M20/M25/M40 family metallo-hydrolase [Cyclobacteriaceae bacterium]|nr:M20/M25/M40 family metallo-hydrolase [Cyclobacteriaceae bacterium]